MTKSLHHSAYPRRVSQAVLAPVAHLPESLDPAQCTPVTDVLFPEYNVDSCKNQFQLCARELPHAFCQKIPVDAHDLRNIRHGVLRQSGEASRKRYIPGCVCPTK